MGGFVSRRKRSKVEARSVSTQATESRKAGTNELHVECRAEVATDVHERRKIAPALNIGDGHQSDIQQHEYTIKKRASSENRKRRGLAQVKPERPKSGSKKGPTQGVDFSTQYDFIGLPGQVLPGDKSPVKSNKEEKTTASKPAEHPLKEAQQDPEVSMGTIGQDLTSATEQLKDATAPAAKRIPKSPRTRTARTVLDKTPQGSHSPKEVNVVAPARRETRDQGTEQDENFNIVKEGSLLAELRNRDMFGACTDDELGTALRHLCYENYDNYQLQRRPTSVLSYDIDRSERRSISPDLSPRRQRKKTVTYSDQQDPRPCSVVSNYLSDERQPEFRLSLEQIFQENVPCHGEAMEVAAVTGTGSAKVTLPPPEGYHACWNNIEAYRYCEHYTGTTTPIETDFYNPPIEYIDADPAFGGKLKGVKMAVEEIAAQKDDDILDEEEEEGCQVDEDMAEDTLDWNVDDRVRSPSETRTDRVILSDDDDDDNMDMLGDCSIDSVPTTHGQRQSSLTTLKDGDSGRGAIYPSHPHTSSPPETLERVETQTTSSTQKTNEPSNRNNAPSLTKEPDNTTVIQPEANKTMQDKTGKLLMHIGKKTETGEQKSLLEMQEAEAMTLLLLTGTLPGEDVGGGVSRGAGDAQSRALEHATGTTTTDMQPDENREADERAGLASMLDTQSKTSCQLEELQSQTDNTQNGGGLSDVVPYQDGKQNEDDSSAAGGASTTSHLDNNAPNIPDRDGGSGPLDTPTSASRYIVGHNSTTDSGAAAALAESRVEELPRQLKGSASPGAASSEGDWEVIPVRRVPGQTSLSGSAASGACTTLETTNDTTLLQMNAPHEQAEEQQMTPVTEGSQVTSAHSSTQPPSSNQGASGGKPLQEDNVDESIKGEGAGDSPRPKRAEMESDPDQVVPVEKEMAQLNQNANNATSEAVAKSNVTHRRGSTEKKKAQTINVR